MAWDTEKTKQLLLDAATEEFSTYGLAGARVDRIATTAGVNKERIYQYFGKKDELFRIVLERELARVMDAVPITGTGVDAVADFAGRVFDYHSTHPQLARLTFWEGLESAEPVAMVIRAECSTKKIDAVRVALPSITEEEARDLVLTILTLSDGWQVLGPVNRAYTGGAGGDGSSPRRRSLRRTAIVTTIRATAAALDAG